jgi:hypothetical protein
MTNSDEDMPTQGSGDGGTTGTPSQDTKEEPPSHDQDSNMVVSGGGVADKGDEDSATG